LLHSDKTNYTERLGKVPRNFTSNQIQKVVEICKNASLARIAKECKFPDWLGYLGLVLHHLGGDSEADRQLSLSWAEQLKNIVPRHSRSYINMESIISNDFGRIESRRFGTL
jgi:hypothetical protein